VKRIVSAAGIVCLLTASVQTQTSFRTRVESVRLDVLVTAGDRPLLGLSARDFEVRDNDELQQVTLIGAGSVPLDVILALDMSSSLTAGRLTALRSASASLVKTLEADDRAAVVTFNQSVSRLQPLSSDHRLVERALADATPSGATSLVDAMYASIGIAEPGDRRTLLIVFSDGIDTASWLPAASVVRAAQRSETVIYAVSTAAANRSPTLLSEVTGPSGGKVLEVDSARLRSAFVQILTEFRERYLLSYTLPSTASAGWHRIDVRVKRRGAQARTRSGYEVPAR